MEIGRLEELDAFLSKLAANLTWARHEGILLDEFFNTTTYNYQSVAHSRIHALIAKTGFDMHYVVEVESGFKHLDRSSFRPDVQLWDSDDLRFLIEYESTNSSDSRIVSNDLSHYGCATSQNTGKGFPEYWFVIYTLPDSAANEWTSWDYSKNSRA